MDSSELVSTISGCSTVVTAKEQVSANLADHEVVILNLESGVYYGLDAVGARVWSLIQETRTVEDICNVLIEEYNVDADRCERELLVLLHELAAQGLIEVKDATGV